jgi:hypothetical protein
MNQQKEIREVILLLSFWVSQISLNNALELTDINKLSEDLSLKLLNEIYGYKLKNLNQERRSYPGIDLGDSDDSHIAFQITSESTARKIKESLKTFADNNLNQTFRNGMKFLLLKDKRKRYSADFSQISPSFDPKRDIVTIGDLVQEISKIYNSDISKFERLKHILRAELSETRSIINNAISDLLEPEQIEIDILLLINNKMPKGASHSYIETAIKELRYEYSLYKLFVGKYFHKNMIRNSKHVEGYALTSNGTQFLMENRQSSVYVKSKAHKL